MARPRAVREAEEAARAAAERASVAHIAFLAGVSQASVIEAKTGGGCPTNDDGTLSWPVVRAWAQANGKLGYAKPAPPPATTTGDARAELDRYKALEARRAYEEAIGKLIPREDAILAQKRLALEFKASLLALPEQLAMALANLPSRQVEAVLRERIEWILSRSRDGAAPIPRELVDAIRRLVEEHARKEPAA